MHIFGLSSQKIPNSDFLQGCRYSNTLADTKEKILESFQPKLMSKTEVIGQKSENSRKWAKKCLLLGNQG